MKDRTKIYELAEQHGIKTKKRVFFDKREDGRLVSSFLDLDRPVAEVYDELVAKGVLS